MIRIFFKRKNSPILNPHPFVAVLVLATFGFVGCSPNEIAFRTNELQVASLSADLGDREIADLAQLAQDQVNELFGTPDSPKWPAGIESAVDLDKVKRAAGPVGRDKFKVESGLFRKHCIQCHGTTGDGMGPASALLAPYPRDFRRGTFKFKSTPIGKKPTHSDLVRTLENGVPGTAMPAFGTLNRSSEFSEDVDALAHYVRFLSIRGEVERRLIVALVNDEKPGNLASQIASNVALSWVSAESSVVLPPSFRDAWMSVYDRHEASERGKEIFLSELTACSKCHGNVRTETSKDQRYTQTDSTLLFMICLRKRDHKFHKIQDSLLGHSGVVVFLSCNRRHRAPLDPKYQAAINVFTGGTATKHAEREVS